MKALGGFYKLVFLAVWLLATACGQPPQGDELFKDLPSEPQLPNNLPTLTQLCPTVLTQDLPYNCAPSVQDLDEGEEFIWSFGSTHDCGVWISIHPQTGQISGIPFDDSVGTCRVTIKVTDSRGDFAEAEVDIEVENLQPSLSISNADDIGEDSPPVVVRTDAQVQANEEGQGVYTLDHADAPAPKCSDNGTVSIDSSTGEVTYQPAASYTGTCNINVQFDDENGVGNSTVEDDFSVTVFSNAPPVINASACSTTATQDTAYTPCTPGLTDPDSGQSHTWSTDTAHNCLWMNVNVSTGELTGTPNDDQVGSCTVSIKANDGTVDSNIETFNVSIANVQPTLTIANAADIVEDSSATIIRADSDVEANEEGFGTYAFDHATTTVPKCTDNGTLNLNATNGQVIYTPAPDYQGTCNIKVEFDDGNGPPLNKVADEFQITVTDQNDPPVVTANCNTVVIQDNSYNCTPTVTDPDDVTHTWSLAPGNTCTWANINTSSGIVTGTPDDNDYGSCSLQFRTHDGTDISNTNMTTVNVNNAQPTLTIADAADIAKGSPATEIRDDGSVQSNEEGLGVYAINDAGTTAPKCSDNGTVTINTSNGAVTYTPAPTYDGTCNITVEFDDENGQGNSTVTDEFAITVTNSPPILTGLANDTTPTQSKLWAWGCDQVCEYRHVINTSATHTFTTEPYSATANATQDTVTETRYIHVQARNTTTMLESAVVSVSAIIDNTDPTAPTGLTLDGTMTETTSDTLNWTASTDETELNHYEMAIGTTVGGEELVSFTTVGGGAGITSGSIPASPVIGVTYYSTIRAHDTAGNISTVATSAGWILPGPPNAITNLVISSAGINQMVLGWSAPFDNGRAISDYTVEYKLTSSGTWLTFADGVSTDTTATVTGLTASTSYDFRVTAYNGASAPPSNVVTGETQPDNPLFDPTTYKAMNLGGATNSAVVAMEDNTTVTITETPLVEVTLDAGETHSFTSTQNQIISGDKPIFVAGRNGTGGDNFKGNIVWNTPDWAGKEFIFTGTRDAPHLVTIYAVENADVTVKQGATTVDSASVTEDNNHTFSINLYGGFEITSTGSILAYMYSSNGGRVVDPKPLLPASLDIIGVPSRSVKITTLLDNNDYDAYHSNSTINSGTLNSGVATSINATGTLSFYRENSMRIISTTKAVANSNADANGYCSAPFLPVGMMKKRYALNVAAQWVAFASTDATDVDVIDLTGTVVQTVTLTRSGAEANAPYKGYLTLQPAGYRFESTSRFGAWYEPQTDTDGADNDETIMFGAD